MQIKAAGSRLLETIQAIKEAVYTALAASALMFGWFAFNIWTGGSSLWPTLIVLCILVALNLASTSKEDW